MTVEPWMRDFSDPRRYAALDRLAYVYGAFTVDDDPEWADDMVDWMLEDPDHWAWTATVDGVEPP